MISVTIQLTHEEARELWSSAPDYWTSGTPLRILVTRKVYDALPETLPPEPIKVGDRVVFARRYSGEPIKEVLAIRNGYAWCAHGRTGMAFTYRLTSLVRA